MEGITRAKDSGVPAGSVDRKGRGGGGTWFFTDRGPSNLEPVQGALLALAAPEVL